MITYSNFYCFFWGELEFCTDWGKAEGLTIIFFFINSVNRPSKKKSLSIARVGSNNFYRSPYSIGKGLPAELRVTSTLAIRKTSLTFFPLQTIAGLKI